ncbi:hypothetical protein LCGC14_2420330 [marine sediment metagenome]|uniref:DUF559 domain-containing protein n=1 Tax=marine sediment metagenome TaxID=412755 RepID=A0A0F9EJ56_9ZZZZ
MSGPRPHLCKINQSRIGKTWEESYGEKAKGMKIKMSKRMKELRRQGHNPMKSETAKRKVGINTKKRWREGKFNHLSELMKGNQYGKGYRHTAAFRKNMSDFQKRRVKELMARGEHSLQRIPRNPYSDKKFAKMHPYLKRQFNVDRFLFDFYDTKTNTDIEIDGTHHTRPGRIIKDKERDRIVSALGYKIVRILAKSVLENKFIDWRDKKWEKQKLY